MMQQDSTPANELRVIRERVETLDNKFDRLLIGTPAGEGLIGRVTRLEERQTALGFVAGMLSLFGSLLGINALVSWLRS